MRHRGAAFDSSLDQFYERLARAERKCPVCGFPIVFSAWYHFVVEAANSEPVVNQSSFRDEAKIFSDPVAFAPFFASNDHYKTDASSLHAIVEPALGLDE
jgi:hypothetical protein